MSPEATEVAKPAVTKPLGMRKNGALRVQETRGNEMKPSTDRFAMQASTGSSRKRPLGLQRA